MLTETQLYQYFDRHDVRPDGGDYILHTRDSQASRMVGVHARKNVCSWFYSEKMQRTISTESRTAERAFVVLSEFDDHVLEIWDQPEPVIIKKHTRKGHLKSSSYAPDFLLLRRDGPVVVEVKDERAVRRLISTAPRDWVERENGVYEFLPAKHCFSDLGLRFEVFVASVEQRFRVFNQELILRARASEVPTIDSCAIDRAFSESFCWSLHDLRDRLKLDNYTALIHEIDRSELFFDWDAELLSEAHSCYVVRRKELLHYVAEFKGPKIYEDGLLSAIDVETMPPTAYAEEALTRLNRIESGESGRSVRRWRAMMEQGQRDGLSAFQSLVPRWYCSGNRKRKINEIANTFLLHYLHEEHPRQGLSDYRSYIRYRVQARDEHPAHPPVSKTTFMRRLRSIPPEILARKKGGKRAANAVQDPSDPQLRQLKAELVWQRAAIDHCLLKIWLVFFDSNDGPHVMRPWLSAMIDLATGGVLAFSVSFLNPSRRSVAKVMRDCVRRHSKLPREMIVDRGPEFRSVYFSALMAHSKVEAVMRPSSHSRYGGEVEGLFGEFRKIWLSQRPGNLVDFKEVRGVDGKFNPKEMAVLTPHDFYREFESFIAWRDARPRGLGLYSPRLTLDRHVREYPFMGLHQKYDDEYLLATAVESENYTLDFQRGIHIDGMWYYSPSLADLRGKRTSLEIRVDPENPHVVYGLIGNQWVPCYSSRINRYSALDPVCQRVEGLIALDAFSDRQKIKQQADEEVVRIIRAMTDSSQQQAKSKVAMLPVDERQDLAEDSVFDLLKDAEIHSLDTESWEVKHVWDH